MGVNGLILLQNTKGGVYASGEPVKGILKYSIDKPTKFTSIDLSLVGTGKCQWSESDSDDSTTYYSNKAEYVNTNKQVLAGRDNQKLPAGTYDCPFEFFLPEDIPTSFKNKTCTIEYKVIATFVEDDFLGTKNFEAEVTVHSYVKPLSLEPLIFGLQKDLFAVSSNKKIEVKAEIERTFLTPGENIEVKLTVITNSDVPITFKTELMKYLTYVSDNKRKQIDKESVKTTTALITPTIQGKGVSTITCVVPTLPNLYSIQHAKVMVEEYKLRLTVKLPFPHIDASVEVPVGVGVDDEEKKLNVEEYFKKYANNN